MIGYCVVIFGRVWLLSGDFWPRLAIFWWFLAMFGYFLVISGRVWSLCGDFWPCLVVVS